MMVFGSLGVILAIVVAIALVVAIVLITLRMLVGVLPQRRRHDE